MKVLVTGFEPFGGEKINPSLEIVKALPDKIGVHTIIKKEIPTLFYRSSEILKEILEKELPDVVILLGQAGGRAGITPERVAINVADADIADNNLQKPEDERIFEDGVDGYFSKLPIKKIVKSLNDAGIPAYVSNSAGTFVCNYLFYSLLYFIDKFYPDMKGGFIHIPFLPKQVIGKKNTPSLSFDMIFEGIKKAIIVSCEGI